MDEKMNYRVTEPKSDEEFAKYHRLRWEVLRKPWNQPEGTERDALDATSVHAMIVDDAGEVLAVGRLHLNSPEEAQVRYMAVRDTCRGKGLGRQVLEFLERKARDRGARFMVLQARDEAVGFYTHFGYTVMEKTFLLFDDIQHFRMRKSLS